MSSESTHERVKRIIDNYDRDSYDLRHLRDQCVELADQACVPEGEYDLYIRESAEQACRLYCYIADEFHKFRASSTSLSILSDAWNRFGTFQYAKKKCIYRAGLAVALADLYLLMMHDVGAATRWAFYAHANDILNEHSKVGGSARDTLTVRIGISEHILKKFDDVANDNLNQIKTMYRNDWSNIPAFAEDVVLRFAIMYPEFAPLLAFPSLVQEFPLSNSYFRALADKANILKGTASNDGKALEDLASYLFLLIPGFFPKRNTEREGQEFEIDMLVRNLTPAGNLTAEIFGRHFIVECKNWSKGVNVEAVGYFLHRMRLTHSSFGVLFAQKGVTGSKGEYERAARRLIKSAFHEDGSTCIVIEQADLDKLENEGYSFLTLLLEKIEEFRFGKSKSRGTRKNVTGR